MKIVTKQDFLDMPEYTLYSKFKPLIFDGLYLKMGTLDSGDFVQCNLIAPVDAGGSDNSTDMLFMAIGQLEATGKQITSLPLDFELTQRNGNFDDDKDLYAVYEKEDIKSLIRILTKCL